MLVCLLCCVSCKSLINPLIPLSIVITRPWGVNNFTFVLLCASLLLDIFCLSCCCHHRCRFFEIIQRILIYILALYGELMLFNEQTNIRTSIIRCKSVCLSFSPFVSHTFCSLVFPTGCQAVNTPNYNTTKHSSIHPNSRPTSQSVNSPYCLLQVVVLLLLPACLFVLLILCRCCWWMLLLLLLLDVVAFVVFGWVFVFIIFIIRFVFTLFYFPFKYVFFRFPLNFFQVYCGGMDSDLDKSTEQHWMWMVISLCLFVC